MKMVSTMDVASRFGFQKEKEGPCSFWEEDGVLPESESLLQNWRLPPFFSPRVGTGGRDQDLRLWTEF